jgi:hypothetical protein
MSFSATISSSLDVDMMAGSEYRRCDVKKETDVASRKARLKSSQGKVCPIWPLNMADWGQIAFVLLQGFLFYVRPFLATS